MEILAKWPEFTDNFKACVYNKATFRDSVRMERLVSVLDGDAKKAICSIGKPDHIYFMLLL